MRGNHDMKLKTTILTLTLSALSLFAIDSYGQDRPLMSKEDHERMDSLEAAHKKEQARLQQAKDEANMDNARDSKRKAKAIAKEAKRVETEADNTARESQKAYRAEKKAQKSRKQADKQAEKAAQAKNKSDKN
jgi:hypothetical protein